MNKTTAKSSKSTAYIFSSHERSGILFLYFLLVNYIILNEYATMLTVVMKSVFSYTNQSSLTALFKVNFELKPKQKLFLAQTFFSKVEIHVH